MRAPYPANRLHNQHPPPPASESREQPNRAETGGSILDADSPAQGVKIARRNTANDLPIGSGEIESAHRYIAQLRLKRPGAWWRVEHAEYMLALRINRRNGDWKTYWATFGRSSSPAANQNRPHLSRQVAA